MDVFKEFLADVELRGYFEIDRRSLEFYRLFACFWTFRDIAQRLSDFEAFHCDSGLLNDESFTRHGLLIHKLLFYRGSVYYQSILFVLHVFVTLMLFFGYGVKLFSFLHYIFTISMHERNSYFVDGGDKLFRHLAFWLAILPTQHYCYYYDDTIENLNLHNNTNQMENDNAKKGNTQLRKRKANIEKTEMTEMTEKGNENRNRNRILSKNHCGFSGMAILFQSFIIYPVVMIRRMMSDAGTWHWNECSALHISLSLFQMIHPSNNYALYFSGQFPYLCFYLCRFVSVVEWIAPLLMIIFAAFPSKYKTIKKFQLFIAFSLCLMHITFAIAFRLSNFVFSGILSLIVYFPSYFWDEFFIIQWIDKYILKNIEKIGITSIISKLFVSNVKRLSIPSTQTMTYQLIGWFFLIYSIMNNMGDFGLFRKPDNGDIGQLLCLPQNWKMFIDMKNYTKFWFMVGEIETTFDFNNRTIINDNINIEYNNTNIIIQDLIVTDYRNAQMYDGKRKYINGANGRPFNPVSLSKNMKWERIFKRVKDDKAIKESIFGYFCNEIERRSPMSLELRRYSRSKDGSPDNITLSANVNVKRLARMQWCVYQARIIHMRDQPGGQWGPSYDEDKIVCDFHMECPLYAT